MQERLKALSEEAYSAIENAASVEDIQALRVKYLGRKGLFAELIKRLPELPEDERPTAGKLANEIKSRINSAIDNRIEVLLAAKAQGKVSSFDTTLPGVSHKIGKPHPITKTIDAVLKIFQKMGFAVVEGPEIETDYNNFEALNIPADHPSRDTFDTFYLKDNLLLRSHTSPVQIRFMQKNKPPFRIVVPGKVYRPDATDASHSFMFHQIEGLMVGEDVHFSDLKGVLSEFARAIFGKTARTRFRPHFFPFTEPSAEVDVSCIICEGRGCRVCSQKGWLEILGAGMVHPNVLRAVKYDAEKYTGFAFGMGIERIAMLVYGIDDIRLFFENDIRFLRQF